MSNNKLVLLLLLLFGRMILLQTNVAAFVISFLIRIPCTTRCAVLCCAVLTRRVVVVVLVVDLGRLFTLAEVVREIKDKKTREALSPNNMPFKLELKDPTDEAIQAGKPCSVVTE